jgi:gentisate 1,2-dioxygenase
VSNFFWLAVNDSEGLDVRGPLAGLARSQYHARDGIPIFYTDDEADQVTSKLELTRPGMVGRSLRGHNFYAVDDGGRVRVISTSIFVFTAGDVAKVASYVRDQQETSE